jgi:hypothetical protein
LEKRQVSWKELALSEISKNLVKTGVIYDYSFFSSRYSRRELLRMLGVGAVAVTLPRLAFADGPTFPKGAVIRTVLKDYAPKDLAGGAILFHEHMSFAPDFVTRVFQLPREANGETLPPPAAVLPVPTGSYFMRDENLLVDEMTAAKSEGIACIVDGGHPDMGRDINFLKAISSKSGLPIVAGGGFYTQPFYPKEISTWSENQIFDALMKQVDTEPIGAWGEIGSWDWVTTDEAQGFPRRWPRTGCDQYASLHPYRHSRQIRT